MDTLTIGIGRLSDLSPLLFSFRQLYTSYLRGPGGKDRSDNTSFENDFKNPVILMHLDGTGTC